MSQSPSPTNVHLVSVVRDPAMYRRCVAENPFASGCQLHALDNRQENAHVSVQYNRFLDSYDHAKPGWLVFCHEDFEILEPLGPWLSRCDPGSLQGPIGAWTRRVAGVFYRWGLSGCILETDKEGKGESSIGSEVPLGTLVETFDCQCLMVHSSLVEKTGLRFDPELAFDLYVEDFCIQARERFGIASRIVPVRCRHRSHGHVGERYREHEQYLRRKYPKCCYTGTSSYDVGTPGALRWCNSHAKNFLKAWLRRARALRR